MVFVQHDLDPLRACHRRRPIRLGPSAQPRGPNLGVFEAEVLDRNLEPGCDRHSLPIPLDQIREGDHEGHRIASFFRDSIGDLPRVPLRHELCQVPLPLQFPQTPREKSPTHALMRAEQLTERGSIPRSCLAENQQCPLPAQYSQTETQRRGPSAESGRNPTEPLGSPRLRGLDHSSSMSGHSICRPRGPILRVEGAGPAESPPQRVRVATWRFLRRSGGGPDSFSGARCSSSGPGLQRSPGPVGSIRNGPRFRRSPRGATDPRLRPPKGSPAPNGRQFYGPAGRGGQRTIPNGPRRGHPEMVDLDDRARTFAPDESDASGCRVGARPAQPFGEDRLQPAGRKGRVPRHLDAEVAGAGGTVTGRGR
jgi:hypothetical protein